MGEIREKYEAVVSKLTAENENLRKANEKRLHLKQVRISAL